eukprot:5304610-Prymnesium_polylepis.1
MSLSDIKRGGHRAPSLRRGPPFTTRQPTPAASGHPALVLQIGPAGKQHASATARATWAAD